MATSTLGPGTLVLAGTTSGTTTVTATAVAGTTTLTLPAATDTLVGKATTDTLTNKTLTGAVMNGTLGATTPSTGAFTTLSATGVTTVQAGTAALPAITTTGDTNTGIFFPAADTIAFSEGGAEAARFDSSGNLGLGVTPSAWDSAWKATQIGSTGFIAGRTNAERFYAGSNAYYNGTNWIYVTSGRATYYASNLSQHEWYIAGSGTAGNAITFTQAMTLDASGNLGVGTTSPTVKLDVSGGSIRVNEDGIGTKIITIRSNYAGLGPAINVTTTDPLLFLTDNTERARISSDGNLLVGTTSSIAGAARLAVLFAGNATDGIHIQDSTTTSGAVFQAFSNSAGTSIGNIARVTTTNAVVYNTTSDYRLKTVIGAVTGQGARLDALKPVDYLWKEGNTSARGFLAHEFQTVYPNSVTGDKDAVDADGNPKHQSMQAATSEVIADLVAEIQSLRKRLAAAGI